MLIVDEPTRGIDVGTKAEVHHLLSQLAADGVAVLMVSSELPEVLGMADRVLVMHEGRLVADHARRRRDGGVRDVRRDRPGSDRDDPRRHAEPGPTVRSRSGNGGATRTAHRFFVVRELGIVLALCC